MIARPISGLCSYFMLPENTRYGNIGQKWVRFNLSLSFEYWLLWSLPDCLPKNTGSDFISIFFEFRELPKLS